MLDDLYQADTDAAIADMVARPVIKPQATKFNGWKAITAVPRGAVAGAIETGAMVPDLAEAAGNAFTSVATGLLPDPRAPGGAEFKAREQQRAQGASSTEGDYLRQQTKQFMPDPHSAHLAEQTVFGLSRFATKAVGSTVVAGPAGGAVALGVNEGLTTADDLKAQGVDLETRTKIGAVAGAVSAVGVALPMAGKTVGTTVGLWAAGGPASFIGQQAATKQILQSAGYDKLSDQIDPLDPVGLAVSSVVPAGFAAWGLRRQAAVKALKTEADVKAAAALTPDEQARSDAFETSDANLDLLRKDITQAKTPAAKAALQENLDSLLKLRAQREASGAPTLEQVDAARVKLLTQHVEKSTPSGGDDPVAWRAHDQAFSRAMDQLAQGERVHVSDVSPVIRMQSLEEFVKTSGIKAERLPPSVDGSFLAWLRDRGGVDFAAKRDITGEGGGITANPGGIFRNGGMGLDELARMAEADGYLMPGSIDSSMDNGGTRALADLIQRATSGERVLTVAEQMQKAQRDSVEQAMQERLGAVEQRLRAAGIDPSPARGNVAALEAYEQSNRLRIFAAAIDEARGKVEADPLGGEYEAMARQADQIAQDISDAARTVSQYEAEVAPLSPVMRKMVQRAMDQATTKEPANVQDAPKAAGQPAEAPAQTQPQTAAARGAGPAGAGEQGVGVSGAGGATAEAGLVAQRLTDIQQQFPDLTVQMDGMDAPVKLADFLEQVKREAMEGTDMDLGGNDAPLMQVAANCFLLNG